MFTESMKKVIPQYSLGTTLVTVKVVRKGKFKKVDTIQNKE